ncbi:MAG: GNAT family N-acetyltransferase, partial [Solimonas sp.]
RRDDAAALVPLVYASGPAAFDYVFAQGRRRAEDFLSYALADGRGLMGWPQHHVAVFGGEVVACVALFGGGESAQLSQATLGQYFRFYAPWTALRVLRRALQLGNMQPPPQVQALYIAHLSVAGHWRGRRIGTQLVAHALRVAAVRGHSFCALDVARDNTVAQALYAAQGFRFVAERAVFAGRHAIQPSRRLQRAVDPELNLR